MTDNFWTDEKIEMLRNLVAAKHNSGLIAQEMNISRNAVIGKAYRLGLKLQSQSKTPSGRASRARQKPSAPTVLRPSILRESPTKKPVGVWADAVFVGQFSPRSVDPILRDDGQMHDTLSITDKGCKWIVEGHGKNARYCGNEAVQKWSCCVYHMTRLLVAPKQEAAE